MGPDYMTDIISVETADHARLEMHLSYNWHFGIDLSKQEDLRQLFNNPDFVGDACKTIASRIRGAVAKEGFDTFHKASSEIIQHAVFGTDSETDKPKSELRFKSNGLIISNVDIQVV